MSACSVCGTAARPYLNAWLCDEHAPAVPAVDPLATLDGLRRRRDLAIRYAKAAAQ